MIKILILLWIYIFICVSPGNAQKNYAMLVGISDYHALNKTNEWNDIHGTNDVSLIAPTLKKQGFDVNVVTETKATQANILKQLNKLTKKVSKGGIVYIHFSCHGQPFEDLNGDEQDGWDESLVPIDALLTFEKGVYEGEHHITDDLLAKYIEELRFNLGNTGKLYVVIDACHAGTASRDIDDESYTRGTKRGFSPNGRYFRPKKSNHTHFSIPQKAGQAPAVFLEACKSMQVNTETKKDGKYYGPMSYYIHQILSTSKLNKDDRWVYTVQSLMRKDIDAKRQDMVIEISK